MTKDEALKMALETADGILNSDYRNWQELSSPEEFERWVKARANHMAIALRQALDQLPDATKMIDTGTDRGAWSDVPDATKWVDELRGDDHREYRIKPAEKVVRWLWAYRNPFSGDWFQANKYMTEDESKTYPNIPGYTLRALANTRQEFDE